MYPKGRKRYCWVANLPLWVSMRFGSMTLNFLRFFHITFSDLYWLVLPLTWFDAGEADS